MAAFIYITFLCTKHYGALKWEDAVINTSVVSKCIKIPITKTWIWMCILATLIKLSDCGVQWQMNK